MSEMYPEENITPRQDLLENQLKTVVETFGPFDQSTGADGAHYVPASPFAAEGMVCSSCVFFEGGNRCEIVSGEILPEAICKFWIIPENLINASSKGDTPGMKIKMNASIHAADVARRTLTGKILPFGEVGNPNIGRTVFAADSVALPANPSDVKLNVEHGATLVGKGQRFWVQDNAIWAEFKIANTTAGNDILVEASEGLRENFSIEVIARDSVRDEAGLTTVLAGDLIGCAVVARPAFQAPITEIAAKDNETEPSTDGEAQPTQEETVENTTTPAEAVQVEAAAPSIGLAFTSPRVNLDITAGEYAINMLKAQQGDWDAQQVVNAAVAQDTLAENPGVVPVRYLTQVLNMGIVDGRRPVIDRLNKRALPQGGQKFNVPTWATAPSVAETAEFAEFSSTDTAINAIEVTKKKAGGVNRISAELIEFSDPNYLDELIAGQIGQYYRYTDTAVITAIKAGAGASGGTGYVAAINDGIADSGAVLRRDPSLLLAGSTAWAGIKGAVDGSGRPLYNSYNPMNAAGVRMSGGLDVQGLEGFVDYNASATDLLVFHADSATFYENAAPVTIRLQYASDGSVEVATYGWYAIAINSATSVRAVTVS